MLEKSIILVGVMGAGKSTIGRKLALSLGVSFFDSDDEIVTQEKMSIADLFIQKGESYFRQIEETMIKKLLAKGVAVIAIGGGAFENTKTRARINQKGISIWLSVNSQLLATRLWAPEETQKRPLIAGLTLVKEREDKLQELITKRTFAYRQAHFVIDAGSQNPDEIVAKIFNECLIKPESKPLSQAHKKNTLCDNRNNHR